MTLSEIAELGRARVGVRLIAEDRELRGLGFDGAYGAGDRYDRSGIQRQVRNPVTPVSDAAEHLGKVVRRTTSQRTG